MCFSDTSSAIRDKRLRILRDLSGEQRILLAFEMSEFAKELATAGIRRRHPDWEEWRINLEWCRIVFWPDPLPAGLANALRSAAH